MRKPTFSALSAFRNPVFLFVVGLAIAAGTPVSFVVAHTFGYRGTEGQWVAVQIATVVLMLLVPSGVGVLIDLGSRRDPGKSIASGTIGTSLVGALWLVAFLVCAGYTVYAWSEFWGILMPGLQANHFEPEAANRLFPYHLRFGFSLLATLFVWSWRKK